MQTILNVAQCIYEEYKRETGVNIDEMKLHKLLYFAQRESLAISNRPLFDEPMEGWIHGPVSPCVRSYFTDDVGIRNVVKVSSPETEQIVRNVISAYGHYASWKLRDLSHEETSWKKSRKGLSCKEIGSRNIQTDDIREDAKKIRPFDYTWGMYYDEFDDYEGDLLNG